MSAVVICRLYHCTGSSVLLSYQVCVTTACIGIGVLICLPVAFVSFLGNIFCCAGPTELRTERDEEVVKRPRPAVSEDDFLALPQVQNAAEGPLFNYRNNRLSGLYKKVTPPQAFTSLPQMCAVCHLSLPPFCMVARNRTFPSQILVKFIVKIRGQVTSHTSPCGTR